MKTLTLATAILSGTLLSAHAAITYIDAAASNTTLADGSAYNPTATTINTDNQWSLRTLGNGATVYTANDSNANPGEDAPLLRTTVTGLTAGESYALYTYFWGAGNDAPLGNQQWDIRAGLTADTQEFYNFTNTINLGHALTGVVSIEHFTNNSPAVMLVETDRRLYQAELGTAVADANGQISIYINDAPGNINRTWYDGVGYAAVPEPSTSLLAGLSALALLRRRR